MKRYTWLTLLVLTAVQAAGGQLKVRMFNSHYYVRYDPAIMQFGLTPEEAQRRLLRWMNTPGLQLRLIGVTASSPIKLENLSTGVNTYYPHWYAGTEPSYLFVDNYGREYVVAIVPTELWVYRDPSALREDEGEDSLPMVAP